MRNMILAAGFVLSAIATPAAKAEDTRTAVDLPPDVKTQFLEHMRTRENSLNNVVQLMSEGKIREAGSTARKEMAIGEGQGFGRYMPPEFREMGFEFPSGGRRLCPYRLRGPGAARCDRLVKAGRRPRQDHGAVQCLPRRLPSEVIRDYCKAQRVLISPIAPRLVLEPDCVCYLL